MPISDNFTDIEFEYIREMCRLSNTASRKTDLKNRLDGLNAAEVGATQRDIEKWKGTEYGTEKSQGGIRGTDFSAERNRNFITNKVRERLDYPPIDTTFDSNSLAAFTMMLPSWSGTGSDEFSK